MFYKGGEVISDQFEHFIIIQRWHPLSPWSDVKIKYGIFSEFSQNGGGGFPYSENFLIFYRSIRPNKGWVQKNMGFFLNFSQNGGASPIQKSGGKNTGQKVIFFKTKNQNKPIFFLFQIRDPQKWGVKGGPTFVKNSQKIPYFLDLTPSWLRL